MLAACSPAQAEVGAKIPVFTVLLDRIAIGGHLR
jgi:hypothetical protein